MASAIASSQSNGLVGLEIPLHFKQIFIVSKIFQNSFLNLTLSLSRTCKRLDQEELSKEEMVEIEEEMKMRRDLLERKCKELERNLPKPKKDVSHLR